MFPGSRNRRNKGEGQPTWSWRRSVVIPLILYACYRLSMMEMAPDTRVNETIAWGWIVIIISCVFFYTGFATAQDVAAIFATRSGMPYDQQPPQYYQQTTTVAPADPSLPVTTTTTVAPGSEPQPPAGYAG